ncbi:ASCH domain-containing protein [Arthrobacter sp. CAU 1506]|uniref:ASCH domain-containing protein n=1 Tax=Arthrobacter sp. CAU 1506 TaxID=2560052 RepID=UPI002697B83E
MTTTQPCASPDRDAARRMWREYAAARPGDISQGEEVVADHFGDSAALADELLGLVLAGQKRATATLAAEFHLQGERLPRIGDHWVACDGSGKPQAILRSTELRLGPPASVDQAFAWDEGEDDRQRSTWLEQHLAYWQRVCAAQGIEWRGDNEVVFERFRIVWPPDLAN